MNFFGKNKWYISGFVVVLIIILLALLLPAFLFEFDYLKTLGTQQLYVSIAAFSVIWITLLLTIGQFRKSMAKPKLEVIFSENGKSEISIDITRDIPEGTEVKHELILSVVNKGNAITKLFQIDFIVPAILRPRFNAWSAISLGIPSAPLNPPLDMKEDERIISFCSYEKVYCFVNKPARINTLLLGTLAEKYDDYPNEFTITYRIFGDWAETQSGKLKIRVRKHSKEVT